MQRYNRQRVSIFGLRPDFKYTHCSMTYQLNYAKFGFRKSIVSAEKDEKMLLMKTCLLCMDISMPSNVQVCMLRKTLKFHTEPILTIHVASEYGLLSHG